MSDMTVFSVNFTGQQKLASMDNPEPSARWEHFPHEADMGIRGIGIAKSQAFEQAALALTAVVTDPQGVAAQMESCFSCEAPDDELLLVDWLNALIYEMACRHVVFGQFDVRITDHHLEATARGEPVDRIKHEPAVEIKGATYTELSVRHIEGSGWVAQCVVDV
jgi:tRNA nucleotidyltransferase (CCA-adding enzyme)